MFQDYKNHNDLQKLNSVIININIALCHLTYEGIHNIATQIQIESFRKNSHLTFV